MRGEQLELSLWQAIAEANKSPEDADLDQVWGILDQALVGLDMRSQLQIAGEAVGRLADLFSCRASYLFEELQAKQINDGPWMPDHAFDRYVRQVIVVDFDQYIEPFSTPPRKISGREMNGNSIAEIVDKELLIQALEQESVLNDAEKFEMAIASTYVEDIGSWVEKIRLYLEGNCSGICLTDLQVGLGMPMVEVWMGLLLGEFRLVQKGGFYDNQEIWIDLGIS